MSREIRLGLDCDGVAFDFNTRYCQLARIMFGVKPPPPSETWPTTWDYMDEFLTKEQDRAVWKRIIQSDSFWMDLPIYNHSGQLVRTAAQLADKLYYITSRSGHRVQQQTEQALSRLLHPFTGAVIPVAKVEDKIPVITALRLTHFVDDKTETVNLAAQMCPKTSVAVWSQPWNGHREFEPSVIRLGNVEDMRRWLQ